MRAALKRMLATLGLIDPLRRHVVDPARRRLATWRGHGVIVRNYLDKAEDPDLKYEYVRPLVEAIQKRLAPGAAVYVSRAGGRRFSGRVLRPDVRLLGALLARTFANAECGYLIARDSVVLRTKGGHDYVWPLTHAYSLIAIPLIGAFEPVESAIVAAFSTPGATVLDIGANFGWHTVIMAHSVGAGGSVHAFEPLPDTHRILQENVARLPRPEIVACRNEGLSDQAAIFEMQVPIDTRGFDLPTGASLERTDWSDTHRTVSARFTTLDEYCEVAGVRRLDFLKCDVEGAEMKVLTGGMRTIRDLHPTMLIEVNAACEHFGHTVDAELDLLEDLGYAVWAVDDHGVRPRAERGDAYNFLCVPTEATAQALRLLERTDVTVDRALA